jgi:indolepyruvate ferredoxin oxidoreductase, beta subunit
MTTPTTRPLTLLIAALGGEGGGVLTNWIVNAAAELGFPVQSTSIPGVAQRTGATTYYVEIMPVPARELGERRPVLALTPGIGDIDIVLASELLEAGRAVGNGFVTPDRTLVIASTSRFYAINEKIAMADGRYDQERLTKAIGDNAQASLLIDMEALAKESGALINAVMLGVLAGSGRLPIPAEALAAAIRADGKAVETNLAGFRAGMAAARAEAKPRTGSDKRRTAATADLDALESEIATAPAAAREIMIEGVRRLAAYQDLGYARLYLDRLTVIADADTRTLASGRLLREVARHLAVRMSFEDAIRVAQAKIDPARMRRIADELKVKPDEPFAVVEFLKPGIEEMCQVLPPWLARRILAVSARRGWLDRYHWGMEVETTSITGYLRFWLLAKLRSRRPRSWRYREEQAAIEAWLALILEAAELSPDLAIEVAECARLIKGYGDTHKRGSANYRIIEARIIRPVLDRELTVLRGTDAIASARTAALLDPEGETLARCLDDLEAQSAMRVAAE